jgi:hypothetical protein
VLPPPTTAAPPSCCTSPRAASGWPSEFAHLKLFQSKTIGAGDCIDPIVKQQITVNPSLDDERPSIVLEPASAGASGAELFYARTDGAAGTSGHIWRGAAGCDAGSSFRQLSFAGQIDVNPDASRSGWATTTSPSSGTGPTSST